MGPAANADVRASVATSRRWSILRTRLRSYAFGAGDVNLMGMRKMHCQQSLILMSVLSRLSGAVAGLPWIHWAIAPGRGEPSRRREDRRRQGSSGNGLLSRGSQVRVLPGAPIFSAVYGQRGTGNSGACRCIRRAPSRQRLADGRVAGAVRSREVISNDAAAAFPVQHWTESLGLR